ncbi:MAG TPA: SIR2 family protein, partial [Polyangiaceae bacterium]
MAIPIEFSEFRDRSPSDRLVILGAGASRDLGVPSGEEVIELIQQRKSEMKVLASLCRRAEFEPAVAALDFLIEQGDPFTASAVLSQFLKAYSGPLLISDIAALKNEKRALLQLLRENMYKPRDTSPTDEEREFVDGILDLQRGSTIISLNYDNLLEWAGSDRIVPVVRDGTDRVTVPPTEPDLTRVLHLHGAITWSEYKNIVVDHHRPPHDEAAALVLGVGNKLRYYEPFLEMYQVLRDELRRVSAILTVGFSFRDAHVVQQLTEWAERVGEQGQLHICNPVGELPDQIKDW